MNFWIWNDVKIYVNINEYVHVKFLLVFMHIMYMYMCRRKKEKRKTHKLVEKCLESFTYILWVSRIADVQRVDDYFECIFHEFGILEECTAYSYDKVIVFFINIHNYILCLMSAIKINFIWIILKQQFVYAPAWRIYNWFSHFSFHSYRYNRTTEGISIPGLLVYLQRTLGRQ